MRHDDIDVVYNREKVATPEEKTFGFIEKRSDHRSDDIVFKQIRPAKTNIKFVAISSISGLAVIAYSFYFLFSWTGTKKTKFIC